MTITIYIECDGLSCPILREIDDDTEVPSPWGVDDRTGYHYCPKCWKKVQQEIEEANSGDM